MSRRQLLIGTTGAITTLALGSLAFDMALVSGGATPSTGRYGPLGSPDANGLRLPLGFKSKIIGRSGQHVPSTTFTWHQAPDGGATFSRPNGGWVYVSNSEVDSPGGGASAIAFARDGTISGAYTILSGTSRNCAGGPTPWGTWLSCEESGDTGNVWECDPSGSGPGIRRALLGSFNHEAAAVDPATGSIYLTEDNSNGRLYRFDPATGGDLSAGQLFAAAVGKSDNHGTAAVTWISTSSATPDRSSQTTGFNGGEGEWIEGGRLLFTTKGDVRVWELDLSTQRLRVLHDCLANADTSLNAVDNIVVHSPSRDIFVAEDGGNMEVGLIEERSSSGLRISAFLQVVGHDSSEIAGPAFAPDGRRFYFSSQRGADGNGVTYEIRGPFATAPSFKSLVPVENIQPALRMDV